MKIVIVIKKFIDFFVLLLNHSIIHPINTNKNINILTINPSPNVTRYKI